MTKSAEKLTLKTPERCQRHSSDAFIANIEQISNFTNCSSLSIVDFVQVNAGWNISDSIFLIKPILDDVLSILEVDNYNLLNEPATRFGNNWMSDIFIIIPNKLIKSLYCVYYF